MIGTVNKRGVRFVAGWEGFRSCPYRDAVGVWTIGYGETKGVTANTPCVNKDDARVELRRRLNRDYAPAIPRRNRMKPQEVAALASAAYNLGTGLFDESTGIGRRLRSHEGRTFQGRCRIYREELPKWCYAGGQRLEGLEKRRIAEVRLACNGDYSGRP